VKNYFQYLFTGALLLVALIIFNRQDSEGTTQDRDTPDIAQIELLAEVNSSQFANSAVPPFRLTVAVNESFSGNLHRRKFQYFASHQTLYKAQKQLYLELKPDLDFQSGLYLYHHPRFGDPPVA